jgi:hypothetical protein
MGNDDRRAAPGPATPSNVASLDEFRRSRRPAPDPGEPLDPLTTIAQRVRALTATIAEIDSWTPLCAPTPTSLPDRSKGAPMIDHKWPLVQVFALTPTQRKRHLRDGVNSLDTTIAIEEAELAKLRALRALAARALAGHDVFADPESAALWADAISSLELHYDDDSDKKHGASRLLGAVAGMRVYATGGSLSDPGRLPYPHTRDAVAEEIEKEGFDDQSPSRLDDIPLLAPKPA